MSTDLEILLRLCLAALLGGVLGIQRELAGKPAGIRTHALIALGSAAFTVTSIYGFGGNTDPSRVAAGVVTGIGFLGAGVILRGMRGDKVAGLTTAASVWTVAALGMAAGAGMYLMSATGTLLCVGILMLPKLKG